MSLGLLIFYFNNATKLGVVYLFLQIGIVGGLAFLEGNQLKKLIDNSNIKSKQFASLVRLSYSTQKIPSMDDSF